MGVDPLPTFLIKFHMSNFLQKSFHLLFIYEFPSSIIFRPTEIFLTRKAKKILDRGENWGILYAKFGEGSANQLNFSGLKI